VRFGVESDKGEFMNHSCGPTVCLVNDDLWIASRDIEVGEEVCYDYAMSETPDSTHMPFDCRCGTAACRGRITGLDCLLPALREKYGVSFTTLVQKMQAEADKAKATA